MVKKFTEDASSICSKRVNQSLHNTPYKLSKDPNIRVCKHDKRNGIAVMNTEDYYGKLDKIVNDKSKFVEPKEEAGIKAIIQKETSITYYIKKYMKKIEGYAKLIPSGSKPGKLYGQAKVHKSNVPLRPVVSMVDTPEYNLAKYLDNMIKPYIPDTHLLRSTEDFLERLKTISV